MSAEIILYDLPSKGHCQSWSLNPWKARASLNYKGLPYKTEWVEYPDLAPKFKDLGIEKNDGSSSYTDYSSPAVRMPDGSYVMDSLKIAVALDKLQPQPSLHTDKKDVIDRTLAAVGETFLHLRPIGMPRIPERLLNPRSAEYFEKTRAERFGMSLQDLAKSDKAGENAWKNAEKGMNDLKKLLTENKGPYVLGEEVSFSDFGIGGFWTMVKLLDDNGDLYDRLMSFDSSFLEHHKAVAKWFERKDH